MTANQLAWLNYQETQRSNLAKEAETKRSNLVREAETNRSNLENELLKEKQVYADSANKLLPGLGLLTSEGLNIGKKASDAKSGDKVGLLSFKMHGDVSKAKKAIPGGVKKFLNQSTVSEEEKKKEGK